jgi:hypothetical protein
VRNAIGQKNVKEPVQSNRNFLMRSSNQFLLQAMSLSCDLTTKHISDNMWKMLEVSFVQNQSIQYLPLVVLAGL